MNAAEGRQLLPKTHGLQSLGFGAEPTRFLALRNGSKAHRNRGGFRYNPSVIDSCRRTAELASRVNAATPLNPGRLSVAVRRGIGNTAGVDISRPNRSCQKY